MCSNGHGPARAGQALLMSLGRSVCSSVISCFCWQGFTTFFNNVFSGVQFQGQVGIHLFEPGIFFFQFFNALQFTDFHTAVALSPLIKGSSAYLMLPGDLFGTFAAVKCCRECLLSVQARGRFFLYLRF